MGNNISIKEKLIQHLKYEGHSCIVDDGKTFRWCERDCCGDPYQIGYPKVIEELIEVLEDNKHECGHVSIEGDHFSFRWCKKNKCVTKF